MHEHRYRDVSEALPKLLQFVLQTGGEVGSRAGRVFEVMHPHIVLTQPWRREVTTPLRRASLPAQIAETMWVLAGRSDVEWLSAYLPRAAEFSDDGLVWRGGYGPRIRSWPDGSFLETEAIDQLAFVVNELKSNPLSRRAVISIYDPAVDTQDGKDIPCNDLLMFSSRLGRLDLHVCTRSNDLMWGWSGINAFEWSVLQEVVAGLLGIEVGELHFSINSLHLYDRHWQRAHEIVGASNGRVYNPTVGESPRFDTTFVGRSLGEFDKVVHDWFLVESAIREGDTIAVRDAINLFPEPMFRSWLQVLASWWWNAVNMLDELQGTSLKLAALRSPARKVLEPLVLHLPTKLEPDNFVEFVVHLHAEKHAVYRDSWKRRGELLGILANIARKVDRLGRAGGGDTSADTAIDLLVYLVKYRLWMTDKWGIPAPEAVHPTDQLPLSDYAEPVTEMLRALDQESLENEEDVLKMIGRLTKEFTDLEIIAQRTDLIMEYRAPTQLTTVSAMIPQAARLARYLWNLEQQPDQSEGVAIDQFFKNIYQGPFLHD